jgi:N-acyl-L-homoserine lactone synthetase
VRGGGGILDYMPECVRLPFIKIPKPLFSHLPETQRAPSLARALELSRYEIVRNLDLKRRNGTCAVGFS